VEYDHEDLVANMWANLPELTGIPGKDDDSNGYVDDIYGYDFCNHDPDPMDDRGHGTHCAGTIGAEGNNGIGVVGVNWAVEIMALKFLDSGGSGWTSDAISCVEYATANGAQVMSNSWGGGGYSQSLYDAIAAAGEQGMLFVAAAGNTRSNNDRRPYYPASYNLDNIIAVAATDHNDRLASFSSYGKSSVDLAAPGVNIFSTIPGDDYTYASGTSMAVPHVSGAAALLCGYYPTETALSIKARILASVDPIAQGDRRLLSGGRLNLYNAVGPPPNEPPTVPITAPADGASFESGASIEFAGTATDPEDGDLTASLVWTSSLDGEIGTGGSFSTTLSDGTRTITAEVTDLGGKTGSDSITITVGSVRTLDVAVATDKSIYVNRDMALISVTVTDGTGPVEAAVVEVMITTPNGKHYTKDGTTGADGIAIFTHKVNSKRDGAGIHVVDAAASKAGYEPGSDSTTFEVE